MEINKQTPRQDFFKTYSEQIKEKIETWLATPDAKVFISNIRKEQFKLDRKNKLISESIYKKQLEKEDEIQDAYDDVIKRE